MQRVVDEKEYFGLRGLSASGGSACGGDRAFIRYGLVYLRFRLIRCGMSKKSGVEPPQSKLAFAKLHIFLANRLRLRLTRMRFFGAELRLRRYRSKVGKYDAQSYGLFQTGAISGQERI